MKEALLVAGGGALGAVLRYLLSGWVLHHTEASRFPLSTFAVNVSGCLVAGAIAGLALRLHWDQSLRLFLLTGLLGGYTTFSAFALETELLLRRGAAVVAIANVVASVAAGVAAVWLGMRLAGRG